MGLTIVTHTRGDRPESLARCCESVETCLPIGARHLIIQSSNLMLSRWESLQLDDVIAFVDDDDVVVNDSLQYCWDAIGDRGLSFTGEARTSPEGEVLTTNFPHALRRSSLILNPKVVHHLAMFRTSCITESWDLYKKFGGGLEWMMKVEAGLKGGAVHVPIIGYHWTAHLGCTSATKEWGLPFKEHGQSMRHSMSRWLGYDEFIQVHDVAP